MIWIFPDCSDHGKLGTMIDLVHVSDDVVFLFWLPLIYTVSIDLEKRDANLNGNKHRVLHGFRDGMRQ
jgi:hypothetical protein